MKITKIFKNALNSSSKESYNSEKRGTITSVNIDVKEGDSDSETTENPDKQKPKSTLEKAREKFLTPSLSDDKKISTKKDSTYYSTHKDSTTSNEETPRTSSARPSKGRPSVVYNIKKRSFAEQAEIDDSKTNKLIEIEMRKKSLGTTDIQLKYQKQDEVQEFQEKPSLSKTDVLSFDIIAPTYVPDNLSTEVFINQDESSNEPRVSDFVTLVDTEEFKFQERKQCNKCRKVVSKDDVEEEETSVKSYQSSKLLQPFTYVSTMDTRIPSHSGLTITPETLVLYFHTITPTEELLDLSKTTTVLYLKFRWNFLNFSDELVFQLSKLEPLTIDIYKNYPFTISSAIYKYLKNCAIPFELYLTYDSFEKDTFIGRCDLHLSKGLDAIGKIFEAKLNITNKELLYCYPNLTFQKMGFMTCRYSFIGNEEVYNGCIPPRRHIMLIPKMPEEKSNESIHEQFDKLNTDDLRTSDLEAFQEGLNLVLIRNKALRTTQEDISKELKERTTWMHQELKWKLTLQENAILSGSDPMAVRWRQWKDENTAKVKYRPLCRSNRLENKAVVDITIVDFTFDPQCIYLMLDDKITDIFIDFNFLGYSGATMETEKKHKPEDSIPITFNFKKRFEINASDRDGKILAEMIKNQEKIIFTLVSQPIEYPDQNQSCSELATCQVDMFELIQSRSDVITNTYPFYDEFRPDQGFEVGRLKLIISGVLGMRSVALRVMAPDNFKVV